jgi:mRNA-degrading endonuclease RelE of RelBE toxin-antitoxin system
MSRYRLDVRDKAKEQIKLVWTECLRAEIVQAMLDLLDEPRLPNSELPRELQQRYRLKIDGWRVFYKIDDQDQVVTVREVRPRNRNTYLNVP